MQTLSKTPAHSAPPCSLISSSQLLAGQERLLHARPALGASTTASGESRALISRATSICPIGSQWPGAHPLSVSLSQHQVSRPESLSALGGGRGGSHLQELRNCSLTLRTRRTYENSREGKRLEQSSFSNSDTRSSRARERNMVFPFQLSEDRLLKIK